MHHHDRQPSLYTISRQLDDTDDAPHRDYPVQQVVDNFVSEATSTYSGGTLFINWRT